MITKDAIDRLKGQLLTSGLSEKNQPLFQIINQLINAVSQSINDINTINTEMGGSGGTPIPTEKIITTGSSDIPAIDGIDGEPGPAGPIGQTGPRGLVGPMGLSSFSDEIVDEIISHSNPFIFAHTGAELPSQVQDNITRLGTIIEFITLMAIPVVDGDTRTLMNLIDSSSFGLGVGGGIAFGGRYNTAGLIQGFAGNKGIKENAVDGSRAGAYVISVSNASGVVVERFRIDSEGNLLRGTAISPTTGTMGDIQTIGVAPTVMPADSAGTFTHNVNGIAQLFGYNENLTRQQITGLRARVSSQFDKTADTTLANVTGLTLDLQPGTYDIVANLFCDVSAAGGQKFAVGGTATATSIIAGTNGNLEEYVTSLGAALYDTVTGKDNTTLILFGTITVSVAGTLTIQFAQSVASGTSSVLVGSTLMAFEIGA